MAFTPAHVGPWAVGEKLTSAQINQLDADHVKSLDKTGDTIDGGLIQVNLGGEIRSNTEGGLSTATASGVKINAAGGLLINSTGGLTLFGSTNWPTFFSTRTVTRSHPFNPYIGTGWTMSAGGSLSVTSLYTTGPGTASSAFCDITPFVHDGATLNSVTIDFAVTLAHPSIASMVLPKANVARTTLGAGQSATNGVSLSSGGAVTLPTPGSAAAYVNSNLSQSLVFTCDQNNVIDKSQYKYTLIMADENGTNSVANSTAVLGVRLTHTVANMKFG
jgi:hypothetical protein